MDSELALPWELYQDLEDDALGDSTTITGAIADAPNKTIESLSDQKPEVHQTEELSSLPFGAGEFLQNILVKAVPGLSGNACPQMVVSELSDTITAAIADAVSKIETIFDEPPEERQIEALSSRQCLPFGGLGDEGMPSAPEQASPTATEARELSFTVAQCSLPFGGLGDDGMPSAPEQARPAAIEARALSFTVAQCLLPFGGYQPRRRRRNRRRKRKRKPPTEVTTSNLPACRQHFYFPFGGWDENMTSAPDNEVPPVPGSGHDW